MTPSPSSPSEDSKQRADGDERTSSFRGNLLVPCATVFAASFCVMVIELVAGRIIAGTLGSSLYTWTSVIGIVLAGLAIGNYAGGLLSDRFDVRKALTALFIASSAAALSISLWDTVATGLDALSSLSWPLRVASHVAIVFFVPSCLLGTISPVAAKMALDAGQATGRTIGSVYAWGVVGSILGTFATGFYLIATFGTTVVIIGVATTLAMLAVFYQAGSWKTWAWLGAVVAIGVLTTSSAGATRDLGERLGLRAPPVPGLLYETESQYSRIRIIESETVPGQREMILDSLLHSKMDPADPLALRYRYDRVFAAVTLRLRKAGETLDSLTIGGGGYTFPRYLESAFPRSRTDVVEIDPAVTKAAKLAFGLAEDTRIRTFHEDARVFVNRRALQAEEQGDSELYDAIYVDAFNHHSVPFQLTTRAFTANVRAMLKPDGVFMTHLIDTYREGRFLGATINTLKEQFSHVYVFVEEFSVRRHPRWRNTFVVVGLNRALDIVDLDDECTMKCQIFPLSESELAWLEERGQGLILTDEFAPIENLLASVVQDSTDLALGERIDDVHAALDQGDRDTALRLAREALTEIPDDSRLDLDRADVLTEIGMMLFTAGRGEEAMRSFERALELDSSSVRARIGLIDCHRAAGAIGESLGLYNDSVIAFSPLLRYNYATALAMVGRYQESVEEFERVAELAPPNLADTYNNWGQALMLMGNEEAAIGRFEQSLEHAPGHLEATRSLARMRASR